MQLQNSARYYYVCIFTSDKFYPQRGGQAELTLVTGY